MGFRLLLLTNLETPASLETVRAWPERLQAELPQAEVHLAAGGGDVPGLIGTVDAIYGKVEPETFARARALRWIQSPLAGPEPSFYHRALVESDVVVTNMRGIFSDHIGAHILALVLGFARGLPTYAIQQYERRWKPQAATVHLPAATALIVGVGGIGAEAARLCAAFGLTVTGVDPRETVAPAGVERMAGPEALDDLLPAADFVIVTAPETPATQGLFDAGRFARMKPSACFINIGRGATVVLDDLDAALRSGTLAGAALDVFQVEPLPVHHPLWDAPGMVITPHVAAAGPHLDQRRTEVFLDNCRRFAEGRALRNVVDKANWF